MRTSVWDYGANGPFDAIRFSTSWCISPLILFAIRAFFSLFIFVDLVVSLARSHPSEAPFSLGTLSNLSFWGLCFYFAFAALHTWTYWTKGEPLLERWPRGLKVMHAIFYATVTVLPFVVSSKCLVRQSVDYMY